MNYKTPFRCKRLSSKLQAARFHHDRLSLLQTLKTLASQLLTEPPEELQSRLEGVERRLKQEGVFASERERELLSGGVAVIVGKLSCKTLQRIPNILKLIQLRQVVDLQLTLLSQPFDQRLVLLALLSLPFRSNDIIPLTLNLKLTMLLLTSDYILALLPDFERSQLQRVLARVGEGVARRCIGIRQLLGTNIQEVDKAVGATLQEYGIGCSLDSVLLGQLVMQPNSSGCKESRRQMAQLRLEPCFLKIVVTKAAQGNQAAQLLLSTLCQKAAYNQLVLTLFLLTCSQTQFSHSLLCSCTLKNRVSLLLLAGRLKEQRGLQMRVGLALTLGRSEFFEREETGTCSANQDDVIELLFEVIESVDVKSKENKVALLFQTVLAEGSLPRLKRTLSSLSRQARESLRQSLGSLASERREVRLLLKSLFKLFSDK